MKNLTSNDLGFVPEGEAETSFDHKITAQRKKQTPKPYTTTHTISHYHQSIISKSNILQY
jgi:hypothetical protein